MSLSEPVVVKVVHSKHAGVFDFIHSTVTIVIVLGDLGRTIADLIVRLDRSNLPPITATERRKDPVIHQWTSMRNFLISLRHGTHTAWRLLKVLSVSILVARTCRSQQRHDQGGVYNGGW